MQRFSTLFRAFVWRLTHANQEERRMRDLCVCVHLDSAELAATSLHSIPQTSATAQILTIQ